MYMRITPGQVDPATIDDEFRQLSREIGDVVKRLPGARVTRAV
jgi:hypothetical protein